MGYGIDRGFGYSKSMSGSLASDIAEAVLTARESGTPNLGLAQRLVETAKDLVQANRERKESEPPVHGGLTLVRALALETAALAVRIYEEGDPTVYVDDGWDNPRGGRWHWFHGASSLCGADLLSRVDRRIPKVPSSKKAKRCLHCVRLRSRISRTNHVK